LNVAANVKVVALAAVGCLGAELIRTRRTAAVVGLVAGSVAVWVAVARSTGLGAGWVGALSTPTEVYSWLAPTNQLGYGLGWLTGTIASSVATAIVIGATIAAVLTVALGWSTVRGTRHPVRCLGLVFAALLVFGPVVQPWYLLWMVLPLAVTARTYGERRTLAVVSAVAAMLVVPVAASTATIVWSYVSAATVLAAVVHLVARRQSGTRTARIPTDRSARTPEDIGKSRLYSARSSTAGPSTYAS
jgi:alpha-1,6-mannosyltransferase